MGNPLDSATADSGGHGYVVEYAADSRLFALVADDEDHSIGQGALDGQPAGEQLGHHRLAGQYHCLPIGRAVGVDVGVDPTVGL